MSYSIWKPARRNQQRQFTCHPRTSRRNACASRRPTNATSRMEMVVADYRICKPRVILPLRRHLLWEPTLPPRQCCRKTPRTHHPVPSLPRLRYRKIFDLARRSNAPRKNTTDSWKRRRRSPGVKHSATSTRRTISCGGRNVRRLPGAQRSVLQPWTPTDPSRMPKTIQNPPRPSHSSRQNKQIGSYPKMQSRIVLPNPT